MLRAILSVVVGFVLAFVLMIAAFVTLKAVFGTERVFKPASWEPSALFLAGAIIAALLSTLIAGGVCVAIARSPRPPLAMAVLLLLWGVSMAVLSMNDTRPMTPRPPEVTQRDAARNNRMPTWAHLVIGVVQFAGTLLGARMVRRHRPQAPS